MHEDEKEYAFVKEELPEYAAKYGGEVVQMTLEEEALIVALERLGIRKYFNKIWSSADFGWIKPNRDFFEMAIGNVLSDNPDASREDIVFIGDMYSTDVVGANRAGIKVIWLNYKNESNEEDLPVHCIYDISELSGKVKELMAKN